MYVVGDSFPTVALRTMSAWDIDEEESHGSSGSAGRIGAELYSIIIHYPTATIMHMIPHHVKLDDDGQPVKSAYKKTEYQHAEGTRETVRENKVEKWATKKETLDGMKSETKQACNAIKTFLLKSSVLVWYHNSVQDECSQFAGKNHWHVVLKSDKGANGHFRYLHDVSHFRTMKVKVKAAGGFVRVQAVRYPIGIVAHFNTPPRHYIGCNNRYLHQLWKESLEKQLEEVNFVDLVEEAEGEEEFNKEKEKRYSSWDDEGPALKRGGWEADEEPFILPAGSKAPAIVKEQASDVTCRLLRMLMTRYRANNKSEMFNAIGTLPVGVDSNYKSLWYRMVGRAAIDRHMETCLNYLKCDNQLKAFSQRVDEFCSSPAVLPEDKYETPEMSYRCFVKWCSKQKIDVGELVTNIINVMDKTKSKINTICFIGESNAGKSMMISNPLRFIMRYIGQISNRGADSPFVYQDCINTSLIIMDECIMDPANYEDLKLLLGGETMKVSVKHQGHGTIQRTPVILTGNREPWILNYEAKTAMMNRMYYYEVSEDSELEHLKYMHPGMWWYLKQQYEQMVKIKPFSKLQPYPQPTPEMADVEDPLD